MTTNQFKDKESLMKYVRDNIIGNDYVFKSPYGLRKVLYLDYIASGRGLKFIEDYIQKQVLPEYANTHTTTSVTSLQTSLFRQQARDIIRTCCNANESDSVIFVGSGCTGAIDKILHSLDLSKPPIVFMCPYAHHSLFLPWGEAGAKVIRVPHDKNGLVDKKFLEKHLKKYAGSGRQLIGCFTAASNVTGIISDIDNITFLLHKYGALAFWDYATAAPYVQIDCNPNVDEYSNKYLYKDAVFISPHKFLGGVSTPGVLIAKRSLFKNKKPVICGGGTVVYVTQSSHVYHSDPEVREEGGTPAIVESIRAGLTFQLKEAITPKYILSRENYLFRKAMPVFKANKNLVILGNTDSDRLPVFSFLIYHPQTGRFLHHNFISTILNDVFGIQNRGGCACAGPYAIDLFDMNEETAQDIANMFSMGQPKNTKTTTSPASSQEILKPGFTRLNLPYFLLEEEVQFIIKAVTMVADDGWKLLPQYTFNPITGDWKHVNFKTIDESKSLFDISYTGNHMDYHEPHIKGSAPNFQDVLTAARKLFDKGDYENRTMVDQRLWFDETSAPYRWFLLPSEAQSLLRGDEADVDIISVEDLPFCPKEFKERLGYKEKRKKPSRNTRNDKKRSEYSSWTDGIFCCFTNKHKVKPIDNELPQMVIKK